MEFVITAIGFVSNERALIEDDFWGQVESTINLADDIPSGSLLGIETFSHLEIFFVFDKVKDVVFSGHPRGDKRWPLTGIFAQRKKDRPNRIGSTIVQVISKGERHIKVKGLDALDGTPVIDIKPVFREFIPALNQVTQPHWCSELMKDYWK